jgi:predicted adenine nucleotide alpha hydrolase (AANH) superfamily ATPase
VLIGFANRIGIDEDVIRDWMIGENWENEDVDRVADMYRRYAHEHGFPVITTTLASSRWKSLEQIEEAGRYATAPYPDVTYWEQNWRKGGLSERRIAIIKEYNFYNQQYCGCEFSMRKEEKGG